jgi:hypothetical protein
VRALVERLPAMITPSWVDTPTQPIGIEDLVAYLEAALAARAAPERGSEELLQLVDMMDGINRYRFRNDPELLTAWNAAKHVVSGPVAKEEPLATPSAPVEPSGGGGPAGDVKPAA